MEDDIKSMMEQLDCIEKEMRAQRDRIKISQTRNDNRNNRSGLELCLDEPHCYITYEINEREHSHSTLQYKQAECR